MLFSVIKAAAYVMASGRLPSTSRSLESLARSRIWPSSWVVLDRKRAPASFTFIGGTLMGSSLSASLYPTLLSRVVMIRVPSSRRGRYSCICFSWPPIIGRPKNRSMSSALSKTKSHLPWSLSHSETILKVFKFRSSHPGRPSFLAICLYPWSTREAVLAWTQRTCAVGSLSRYL